MKPMYKCKINMTIIDFDNKEELLEEAFNDVKASNRFSTTDSWFNYKIRRLGNGDILQICMRCDLLTFAKAVQKLEEKEGSLYSIFSTSANRVD